MFRIKIDGIAEVSIDSDRPDRPALIQVVADDPNNERFIRDWLSESFGSRGHLLGEETSPLDLNAAMVASEFDFVIVEGEEILGIEQQELPEGAID